MLIALEGCDGSGKSSVANKLAEVLNAEIIHCTKETPNDMKFFENIIYQARSKNIIADRWCYGQFVYQAPEDRPLKSIDNLALLEDLMFKEGVKLIFVDAPTDVIEARLAARDEKLINNLNVEQVRTSFKALFEESIYGLKHTIYWNTDGSTEKGWEQW